METDLPDPLEASGAAKAGGADDLLAQMAGDEIDRLLAEAEGGETTAVEQLPAEVDPQEMIAQASKELTGESAPVAMEAAKGGADAEISSQLDALFNELTKEEAKKEPEPAPAAVSVPEAAVEVPAVSAELEKELSAPERDLLAIEAVVEEEEAGVPVYLKPLEWVNAPFAFLPDAGRDFLGKAAIVTLVNALVLLAYVHFVRKH